MSVWIATKQIVRSFFGIHDQMWDLPKREAEYLHTEAKRKEISELQLLAQALRTYQLFDEGYLIEDPKKRIFPGGCGGD